MWGEQGVKAVKKKMKQFHDWRIMCPTNPKEMSQTNRNDTLAYLMFLKEKRSGVVKGRGCANGRNVQLWFSKGETLKPTVMMESVFLTSVINAKDLHHVYTNILLVDQSAVFKEEFKYYNTLIQLFPDTVIFNHTGTIPVQ